MTPPSRPDDVKAVGATPWRNRTPGLSHPPSTFQRRRGGWLPESRRPRSPLMSFPPHTPGGTLAPDHKARGPPALPNQEPPALHAHPRPRLGHSTGQPAPGVPASARQTARGALGVPGGEGAGGGERPGRGPAGATGGAGCGGNGGGGGGPQDQGQNPVDANLAAVRDFKGASSHQTTVMHREHDGVHHLPVFMVERAVDEDVLLVGQGRLRRVERRAGSTARKAARWRWGAQPPAAAALFCVTFFAAFVASARLTLPVLAESWTVRREVGAFDVAFTPDVPFPSSPSSVNRQHTGAGQRGQGIRSSPTPYSTPESSPRFARRDILGLSGPPAKRGATPDSKGEPEVAGGPCLDGTDRGWLAPPPGSMR